MSVVRGLKNINAKIEADEARFNGDTVKTKWVGLKDKEAVKLIFLQELDDESESFSEKNDLGFIAVEHSNPDDFKRKALCTLEEEGACWACERNRSLYKEDPEYKGGWKQRSRLYINVLVDDSKEEPYVAVLSQGLSAKQITPALIEHAGEIGAISDKWFKMKRQGAGFSDTQYLLTPLAQHDKNVEDYELFDLNNVVRHVPYAQQEAHYLSGNEASAPVQESNGSSVAGSDEDEW